MFKYQNTVFYDFKSRFLVVFFFRNRVVLKTPFPDHIFPKISKYRTENLLSRPPANTKAPQFPKWWKSNLWQQQESQAAVSHRRMQFYRANFEQNIYLVLCGCMNYHLTAKYKTVKCIVNYYARLFYSNYCVS